ncbi:MAG: DUF4129 domain-containing protein [Firmicutes bacterium]|nr:DUF4129 domain-containing protein [Bacillota bacterium]
MINRLNNISGFLLKAVSETLRYVLIAITALTLIFSNYIDTINVNAIFMIGIANYGISYLLSSYAANRSYEGSRLRFIIPILALTSCLISVFYLQELKTSILKISILIVYAFIWKRGMDSRIDNDYIYTMKRVMLTSVVLVALLSLLITVIPAFDWYLKVFKTYVPIYLIITLLYMARVSILNAYSKYHTNTVDKEKNINRFNIISTVVVALCLLFGIGDYSPVVSKVFNWVERVIEIILYPIGALGAKITMWLSPLFKHALSDEIKGEGISEQAQQELSNAMADIQPDKYSHIVLQVIEVAKWIIFVLIFSIIAYMLYKNFKELFYSSRSKNLEAEEKNFVKPSGDMLKRIRNTFNNLGNIFNKDSYNLDGLHAIRKIYIQAIRKLKSKGYNYENSHTPNEFLANVSKREDYNEEDFDVLTEYYNEVRYGKKELDKDKVEKAIKIKDQINRA